MGEVEYKQKFFDVVRGLLGAEQAALLTDPGLGERISLSLHGPSLVLAQHTKPVKVKDRNALVSKMGDGIKRQLGLDDAAGAQLDQLVGAWADEFPTNFWEQKPHDLEQAGMLRTSRIRDAGRRQVALYQNVLARFGSSLTPEQRAAFASSMQIIVPLPE